MSKMNPIHETDDGQRPLRFQSISRLWSLASPVLNLRQKKSGKVAAGAKWQSED